MIDTERSLEDVARLHAEIMRERAEGLREAARAARTRLIAREEALARLRAQIAMLKASLDAERAEAVPAPALPPPPVQAPSLVPLEEAAAGSARVPRARLAPYAAIIACAAFLELDGARRPAPASADLSGLLSPAPAVVSNGRAAAKGAPVLADEDRSQEAMLLVQEWKLPGEHVPLSERLGDGLGLPGARPTWSVERTSEHGYRVTYQAGVNSLPYAFEADLEARAVWPTPETQELLAPRVAALRGA